MRLVHGKKSMNYELQAKRTNNQLGFTLVELLVTVAVIAILVVIGITVFSGIQSKARDGRRQSDMIAIAKALEVNRLPGSYSAIQTSYFSRNKIPQDSYISGTTPPKYCILSRASGVIAQPTTWTATSTCPTAVEASGTTVEAIPEAGAVPAGSYSVFLICALLEGGTAPNIFCSSSSQ